MARMIFLGLRKAGPLKRACGKDSCGKDTDGKETGGNEVVR
jgi:hypothetical protein